MAPETCHPGDHTAGVGKLAFDALLELRDKWHSPTAMNGMVKEIIQRDWSVDETG
jgi:hypothetical protein